jgi:hypothetical protein
MAQDGNPIGGEPGQGMGGRSERSGGGGAAPHEGGELGGSAQGANPGGDLGGFGGGAGGSDRAASGVDDGKDRPSNEEMSGEGGESGVGTGGGG